MKKLDTLVIKAFIGPFILTTVVATFILLIQYMLKYFDDFVGKDLGGSVFAELIFYFSLNMLQVALPLGVLVSSLMTFGNLGEHFELTAIKSAGISLLRAMRPIFFFVIVLSVCAFYFNNHIVPMANLKAYSLLYDIKHKKPALDIKEGVFYNGIPNYSIKVREKLRDNRTLLDIVIYDHSEGNGNKTVILADSSRMYTMYNDRYLKFELFDGNYYSETEQKRKPVDQLFRSNFKRMDMMFNLSSFDLKRTKEDLFQNNRQMKNFSELTKDIDSLKGTAFDAKMGFVKLAKGYFKYHMKDRIEVQKENPFFQKHQKKYDSLGSFKKTKAGFLSFLFETDSIPKKPMLKRDVKPTRLLRTEKIKNDSSLTTNTELDSKTNGTDVKGVKSVSDKKKPKRQISREPAVEQSTEQEEVIVLTKEEIRLDIERMPEVYPNKSLDSDKKKPVTLDSINWAYLDSVLMTKRSDILLTAKNQAQNLKVNLGSTSTRVKDLRKNTYKWIIEKDKKFSQAIACIVMFLIGAPLGAIIKKGGLGMPVIISIFFFIIFYVLTIMSEKWAKEGLMDPAWAVWVADLSLLPFGIFFLRQARIDARLFDTDFYNIWIDKLITRFRKSKNKGIAFNK